MVCVMGWILHNKNYTRDIKIIVIVLVIGVGVYTVTDVKVNLKGFVCVGMAVLCTSLQQISIGSLQKKYNIGSFDLLSKTAPIQATSLLSFGPFADYYLNGNNLLEYKFSSGAIIFITPFMHSNRVLQSEPISLHWTILSSFISYFGSHENCLCYYIGLASF